MASIPSIVLLVLILTVGKSAVGLVVETIGDLPSPRKLTAAVYDGMDSVYILGGSTENVSALNEIIKFDLSTNTSSLFGTLPGPVSHGAAVMDSTGNIFYFGGDNSSADGNGTIFKVTIVGGELQGVEEFPSLLDHPGVGLTGHFIGDSIYIFGGGLDPNVTDNITRFNPTDLEDNTVVGALPFPLTRATSVAINETVHIFGGEDNQYGIPITSNKIIQFSTTTGEVGLLAGELPVGVESAVAVHAGGSVFVIGGFVGGSGNWPHQRVAEINMDTNVIQEICPTEESELIPEEASGVYSARYNRIYIFGGFTETFQSAVLSIDTNNLIRDTCPDDSDDDISGALTLQLTSTIMVFLVFVFQGGFL